MSHTLIYNLIYALIRFQKITLMYSKHINDIFPPGFCAPGYHNCHSAATCAPTANGFTCTCNQDFQGDGTNCTRKFLPVTKLLFIYFWSKDQCTLKLSSCSVWKTLVLWTTDNYLLAFSHDFFFLSFIDTWASNTCTCNKFLTHWTLHRVCWSWMLWCLSFRMCFHAEW